MKKSVNIWSFPSDWSLEQKLSLAAHAGFEGFEIDFSADGAVNSNSTSSELARLKRLAKESSLVLSGLASGLSWNTNPVSNNHEVREKADFFLRRQIECASDLEIDAILVVPGVVGTCFLADEEPVRYDLAFDRARTYVERALPVAERLGVTIGLENVWNKFLLSPIEMRGFIDSFGSRHVASYFDCGNVLATGYPEHWIQILQHRIVRVHVKDFRCGVGTLDGFVDLLAGDVNWPEVMAALRSTGYSGWIAAEMIPPVPFYKFSPETLLKNTANAMDAILAL